MKIAIVGIGRVGTAVAFALVMRNATQELILIGRDHRKSEGEALDLQHAAALTGRTSVRAGDIADVVGCDIVIVSASVRDLSANRLDALKGNVEIFSDLVPKIARLAQNAIILVLSNPVDAMTYLSLKLSHFPAERVIGTGTLIDTGRFRSILSDAWRINTADVRAYILGEHGDSQFPALSVASAGGVRFDEQDQFVVDAARIAREAGGTVVSRKGFTNYAIASATIMLVEAIAGDTHVVLPVSTLIDGYLGVKDVCLSVPCVVGRVGVVRMLPVDLDEEEANAFRNSAQILRSAISSVS
jgi:L-lactate dehydrogenase